MRLKRCKKCGREFRTDNPGAYFCPDCAAESRQNSVLRDRGCITFRGNPKSKRCPECAAAAEKANAARYRKNGPARKLGSIDICQACGKEYVVNSGRQRYCPECAKTVVAENIRAAKREYNAGYYAGEKLELKYQNRKGGKICPICGKTVDTGRADVYCSKECWRVMRLKYERSAPSHQPEARKAQREAKKKRENEEKEG